MLASTVQFSNNKQQPTPQPTQQREGRGSAPQKTNHPGKPEGFVPSGPNSVPTTPTPPRQRSHSPKGGTDAAAEQATMMNNQCSTYEQTHPTTHSAVKDRSMSETFTERHAWCSLERR